MHKRPWASSTYPFLFFLTLSYLLPCLIPLATAQVETITEVRIEGNLRVEEDAVRLRIKARKGQAFDQAVVGEDVKSIYRLGFFDDVKVEWTKEGVLTYVVKERPYIKEISVGGNSKVSRESIEAALGVRPRTILDRDKVTEGVEKVKKLYGDEGYSNAKVDFAIADVKNNQAVVMLDIKEGKRLLIQKIRFEGNKVFSEKELKGLMSTKEKWIFSSLTGRGVLSRDVLTNDVAIISSHYFDDGYVKHKVLEPNILRRKTGIEIVIRVEEGEQFRVGKVEIGGELIDPAEVYLKKIQLTTGQIFRGSRLREDIETLSEMYSEDGFAYARVDPITRIQKEEKTVDVALIINRGPPVHFNRIRIVGNNKTRDKVIRRELAVSEQDLVSISKVKASQNSLNRTGYFKNVSVTTEKTDQQDAMDLNVVVEEGPTGSLNFGGGFSSGEGVILNASIAEKNLFGRGQSASLSFNLGSKRQDFFLRVTDPYFLDSYVTVGASAFNSELEYSEFKTRQTGFSLNSSYPLKYLDMPFFRKKQVPEGSRPSQQKLSLFRRMRFGTAYVFKHAKNTDIDEDASQEVKNEAGTSLISMVSPSLSFDTRDHFFTPTKGTRSSLTMDIAGLGGDNDFLKWDAKTAWYHTLVNSRRWGGAYTLGLKSKLGLSSIFHRPNDNDSLPISERYFPGGSGSVRGFEKRSLGPRDSSNEPVGGDKHLITTAELVFPVLNKFNLKGVAFFDQGQAFRSSDSFDIGEFRRSIGVGARWVSPFGPLAIDFGFPLNDQPEDDTAILSFSVGGGF